MKLNGSKCVVTGASSGIGLEVVKRLLDEGAVVFAAALDMTEAARQFTHPNLYSYDCDVSEAENIDALFDRAQELLGHIDLFYANAGFAYNERIKEADWKHIEKIYRTNVFSVIYALEKLKMIKGKSPFFFAATASAMAFMTLPGYALYGSTKGALHRFAQSYAYELEDGQVLSLVYPVATRTKFFDEAGSTYVPWPSQSADKVAERIVAGIKHGKRKIFPYPLFRLVLAVFTVLPFAEQAYLRSEWRKSAI